MEYEIIIYCYVVCVNDGFYMEPDISISKVFLHYKDAKRYLNKIINKHYSGAFIEKRKLYFGKKEVDKLCTK